MLDFSMPALTDETYQRYAQFLEQRIEEQQHLTEDSVRYAFFFAILQTTSIRQHEIILELPHPRFPGKEVDTYIQPSGDRQELFIEFKFHQNSASTSPKPQKAGSIFKDISRLSSIKTAESRCLVVYLTCLEMAKYFEKNEAAYSSFWRQPTDGGFIYDDKFLELTTDTFRKTSGDLHRARVHVAYSASLSRGYHLRVFEVHEI